MAKRELQEINAGSMADIAFLLLIFFLVTTTMEVDAGIGRTLPLKIENPPEPPEFIDRNVLEISANRNDDLSVEKEPTELSSLYDKVIHFYTANSVQKNSDLKSPNYTEVTIADCQAKINEYTLITQQSPTDVYSRNQLVKWKDKLELCQSMSGQTFNEMNKSAIIRFKTQSKTSYGLYIEIHNILKKAVNDLRIEKCEEMGWKNFHELDETNLEDQEIIRKLRILVPERIIEPKIDN